MQLLFISAGICALLSLLFVVLLLQRFHYVARTRKKMLHTLGADGNITRSNITFISWFYALSTLIWTLAFFLYLFWLAEQLP